MVSVLGILLQRRPELSKALLEDNFLFQVCRKSLLSLETFSESNEISWGKMLCLNPHHQTNKDGANRYLDIGRPTGCADVQPRSRQ